MLERLGWGWRVERDKLLQLYMPVTFLRFSLSRPWGLFFLRCGPRLFPAAMGWEGMQSSKESGREGKGVSQGSSAFWNGKAKAS